MHAHSKSAREKDRERERARESLNSACSELLPVEAPTLWLSQYSCLSADNGSLKHQAAVFDGHGKKGHVVSGALKAT